MLRDGGHRTLQGSGRGITEGPRGKTLSPTGRATNQGTHTLLPPAFLYFPQMKEFPPDYKSNMVINAKEFRKKKTRVIPATLKKWIQHFGNNP